MKKILNGVEVEMSAAEISELEAMRAAASAPTIPQEVTMRQARLALLGAGLLASVEAAIDGLPEPKKSAARIEWDHSQSVQRSRGLAVELGAALGLSSAQIDALFVQAATL
jgi:hypothetical protein